MRSIIICEGETDFVFLQHFMIRVNGWEDRGKSKENPSFKLDIKNSESRDFFKNSDILTIISCGGCGNIKTAFEKVVRNNQNEIVDDEKRYSKIVILTDNDEDGVEKKIVSDLSTVSGTKDMINNRNWTRLSFLDMAENPFDTELLLLIIPFDKRGALETFLLNSVANQNPYDAEIIKKAKAFVGSADPEKRYLTHRGFKTKAELYAYFSVRIDYTPNQLKQRKEILTNIPWEEYENIQESFKELKKL
ncbi:MAG: DUF3226 domain-containing protein [Lachnospiraceae bacterium]|nr:DUF3226 domain-containing protein [Lachnospiraceae bacterium]